MTQSVQRTTKGAVTAALVAHRRGVDGAFEDLIDQVYVELRRLAQIQLRKRNAPDLQTTALVHELYLKLVDREVCDWNDRGHFFAACATAMRNILIDAARRSGRAKRGGSQHDLPLIEAVVGTRGTDAAWLIAVDQALVKLGEEDVDLVTAFELRFFGGYSAAESARILNVSTRTLERRWKRACAWLGVLLGEDTSKAPTHVNESR